MFWHLNLVLFSKYCLVQWETFISLGQNYDHHQLNPTNECKWCNIYDKTTKLTSSWSNRPAVPCNDNDSCTERDLCKDGSCKGMKYSCNSSYPSSSCIQRSVCDGNGTCQHLARANGTVCRSAVDYCDLSERYWLLFGLRLRNMMNCVLSGLGLHGRCRL